MSEDNTDSETEAESGVAGHGGASTVAADPDALEDPSSIWRRPSFPYVQMHVVGIGHLKVLGVECRVTSICMLLPSDLLTGSVCMFIFLCRMRLGYVDKFGQYVSEIEPPPPKFGRYQGTA